ncbi:Myb-like DNA-binding domain containing protein [Trichomonas vaginalis G3]|uniref:Myb-like DNA-binding domain containing protein n=1 Tax=Trichomonas vaginalis (strain ATCC PRA-98 / G3) TaxID=412133 RepID=A2FDH5_TRIV3|nr:SANT/myb-like telomere repeat binding factor-like DNA-binding domain-containing protein [Trichomonas vaginalis G3]EAX97052.1 Myb-like DNA-binding domain containing protein [Trichomonas vaginalis G3]KAI5515728.1 SANT/myb-like telomere repeat binding factor-like DNA-binding domain-containing protein [Trichomonas vaginalis G3]|eukprot:XP_001309982.1 Myb-like DNA-binding domain containing protein [Trichomonas vaginalis G3]
MTKDISKIVTYSFIDYKDVLQIYSIYNNEKVNKYIRKELEGIPRLDFREKVTSKQRNPSKNWTTEELDAFVKGLEEFGVGNWTLIRNKYSSIFDKNNRTRQDMYRKWVNLSKKSEYQYLIPQNNNKQEKKAK